MKKLFRQKSKRIPAKRRYKIEKKVREHNRKLRKEAKKNKNKTNVSKKKDVIPASCPFKEQILQEAAEQKRRALEDKKNRIMDIKAMKEGNIDPNKMEECDPPTLTNKTDDLSGYVVDRAGIDIPKSYSREFYKVVQDADVLLEVLDARDPLGCRSELIEKAVTGSGSRKRLILVLNKADLIPKQNLVAWLKYLRREYPTVAFKSSTSQSRVHRSKSGVQKASMGLLKSSKCLGADALLHLLANYCRSEDIKTNIIVGVVGYPNVGKSSLINSLKRKKACQVGAVPGMTTSVQTVQLDKHIRLLDCPGLVLANCVARDDGSNDTTLNSNMEALLALRNCVKVENLDDPVSPVQAIIARVGVEQLMIHFKIAKFETVDELLAFVARRSGHLKRGGVPDSDKAARVIINHWNSGKIRYWTEPPQLPKDSSVTEGTTIVTEFGDEFDLDKEILEGTMDVRPSASCVVPTIRFVSEENRDPEFDEVSEGAGTITTEVASTASGWTKQRSGGTDVEKLGAVSRVRVDKKLAARKEKAARMKEDHPDLPTPKMAKINKLNLKRAKREHKKAVKTETRLCDQLSNSLGGLGKKPETDDYDFAVDFK